MSGLDALLVLLALGLPLVLGLQRLGVSALVAYLATGAIAGPGVLGLVDHTTIGPLAEVGAAMLLFSIGLDLDIDLARRRLGAILTAGLGQVGITIAVGSAVAMLVGLAPPHAIAIGSCLAMTSTVMLVRVLDERRLRHKPDGQLAMGVSLVQDIALGPLLIGLSLLIPLGDRKPTWLIASGLVGVLLATFVLRRVLATAMFDRVRSARLPELEVAFSVMVALGAAWATQHCGLGAAVGAFCAGLAFGGDGNRHLIDASTKPLQGLTAIVFFMAMGALFDARFTIANAGEVATVVAIGLLLKAPVCWLALRLTGMPRRTALGYGLALAPVGEFSFVLATAAFAYSDDPNAKHLYQLLIAATCINLAATPLLFLVAARFLPKTSLDAIRTRGRTIVVAGLGPVGNSVVGTLREQGYPLFLIDRNERLLRTWEGASGVRIHQGRIEDMEDWLPALGHRPALVVLTFPIADASAVVAQRLRALEPALPIIARAPFISQVDQLRAAGAQWVICDEQATAEALLPLLDAALADGAKLHDVKKSP